MPSPLRSTSRSTTKAPSSSTATAAAAAAPPLLLPSDDPSTFLTLMADTLRLSSETLTMAYVYIHRYNRWLSDASSTNASSDGSPSDPPTDLTNLLDAHTLSLAALSLATKATESPRRLREFLLPAYTLQHPLSPPLTFPSTLYDALRSTLVAAELLLLRVLRFELRVPLPYDYVPRQLERALALTADAAAAPAEDRPDVKDTALGRAVWVKVAEAMTRYTVCNFFPPRAVAAACVFHVAVVERGMKVPGERDAWLRKVAGERVEYEDFVDALDEIKALAAPPPVYVHGM